MTGGFHDSRCPEMILESNEEEQREDERERAPANQNGPPPLPAENRSPRQIPDTAPEGYHQPRHQTDGRQQEAQNKELTGDEKQNGCRYHEPVGGAGDKIDAEPRSFAARGSDG